MTEEFKNANKLLSKFAHPTALSVIHNNKNAIAVLQGKFYEFGARLGERAMSLIDKAISR
jgi:hypothetical protein